MRWLTATHTLQNIRFIRAGAVPTHNPHKQDNSAKSCNSRFSNRDGDKEAKLMDCSFNWVIKSFIHYIFFKNTDRFRKVILEHMILWVFNGIIYLTKCSTDTWTSDCSYEWFSESLHIQFLQRTREEKDRAIQTVELSFWLQNIDTLNFLNYFQFPVCPVSSSCLNEQDKLQCGASYHDNSRLAHYIS